MFPFKKPKRRGTQLGILLAGNALCPVGLITQAVAAEPDIDPPCRNWPSQRAKKSR